MQSMVVADRSGNIGFVAAGRVPQRDPANRLMGRAPAPGWNAIYDWRGYAPYAVLPRQTNPDSGADCHGQHQDRRPGLSVASDL
jgi:penicillin amidase